MSNQERLDEFLGGTYLTHDDLGNRTALVVIDGIQFEEMTDQRTSQRTTKPVLYFRGKKAGLVLNKTNGNFLKATIGPDPDTWRGTACVLYVEPETGMGPGIRIRSPQPPAEPHRPIESQPRPAARTEAPSTPAEDIPF